MVYTPEESEALIREIAAQKRKLSGEELSIYQRIEKTDKVLRLTWFLILGFALGIIGVTTFYIKINNKFEEFDKKFTEYDKKAELRAVKLEALERTKQDELITAVAKLAIMEGLRRDVDKLTARQDLSEPQNRTMWDMLKRGQSNKEAFFLDKGFEAPSIIPPKKE